MSFLRNIIFPSSETHGKPKDLLTDPSGVPYTGQAEALDIFYCFKLLLGRSPHREEWSGHSSRAGEPLAEVVRTYLNSGEFKARNLLSSQMPENIIQKHNGRFEVFADPDDPVIGAPILDNCYEPEVTRAVESLLAPGDTFLDVGANIGYFSLLASSIVGEHGQVFAIEPNDMNVKLLESSIRSNAMENVTVIQVGASETIGTLMLHSNVGNGTTSAVGRRDLFSSRTVAGIPIDSLLSDRRKPISLIKIDVEGFEYRALRGSEKLLEKDRPAIVFEFSAGGIDGIDGVGFLRWLGEKGYTFAQISENWSLSSSNTIEEIMAAFEASMADHIDVVAKPAISS